MRPEDLRRVTDLLLAATEGDSSGWVDRVGALAESAGLRRAEVCWQGSPRNVAHEVFRWFDARGKVGDLEAVCAESARRRQQRGPANLWVVVCCGPHRFCAARWVAPMSVQLGDGRLTSPGRYDVREEQGEYASASACQARVDTLNAVECGG